MELTFIQKKAIRYLAASMFLLTGILHIYLAINPTPETVSIAVLIGAIIYPATGVSLLMKVGFARWLGLIPIIAIVMVEKPVALTIFRQNVINYANIRIPGHLPCQPESAVSSQMVCFFQLKDNQPLLCCTTLIWY